MDPERQRIEEDLRGLVAGEVRCDDTMVQLYATDASIYEMRPQGVVRPKSIDDVVATARYASNNGLPLHARGAGSGLAGGAVGRGVVIDFSRHMRRVLQLRANTVRVQAGVVHGELNALLSTHGRAFGPDPAMSRVTTMGGVAATNATGSHFLRYGTPRDHVRELRVVLADGTTIDAGTHQVPSSAPTLTDAPTSEDRLEGIVWAVAELLARHEALINSSTIHSAVNCCGYHLRDVLVDGKLNLAKLLCGSEGTLALITELVVDTAELPKHTGVGLLIFDSLDKAARAAQDVLTLEPAACDLMDRRHLSIAREVDIRYELLIPGAAEAVLLIEHTGETTEEVEAKLRETVKLATVTTRLAAGAHVAHDATDNELYWQLAQRFVPTLYRLQGVRRPVPFVEDMAVPVAALPVFLRHMQDVLKREQVTASVFGHAGHGQLHVRPFLDLANPNEKRRMERLASELYEKVWMLGGTISGEHGDGLSRTPFVTGQYGQLVNVFREIKRIFDPAGILNPGKVVPEAGARMIHHLRQVVPDVDRAREPADEQPPNGEPRTGGAGQLVELQLNWNVEQMAHAARICNGCAACRTRGPATRMCPVNRVAPREEASPRAKANLMRAVLTGQLPPDTVLQDACKEVTDLCFHCHMCRIECPANVDIPRLMVEAKAEYVASNGHNVHDWLTARIDMLTHLISRTPRLANWMFQNRQARWLMEKLLGISQARTLPRLARRPFLTTVGRDKLDRLNSDAPHRVAVFVDTYANLFDTELADALLRVLDHNGVEVYVPPSQRHSGMPLITGGSLDHARRLAHRNVAALAEAVRLGYTVICTEPTAVLALTREYATMLPEDEDVRLVSENTQDACHYLWQLHQRGGLQLDFQPQEYEVAHHTPCHLRALEVGTPSVNLLRLVPGLKVHSIEKGCSGMAGTWGLKRRNYRTSLRIGLPLISEVRDGPYHAAMTECSTCAMQIDGGTHKPTVHPIKVLAAAYGLMPPPV
jgi:FAD/FMN-containing dehydrogenase/Fe-S oxidoreductase